MNIADHLYTTNGWNLIKDQYTEEQAITDGSNFMIGNGYLGYRGTFAEDTKEQYSGCFVTDTWDKADGKWEELCNVPNALFLRVRYQDVPVDFTSNVVSYKRELDVKHGISSRDIITSLNDDITLRVQEEKFASYVDKHLVAMKYILTANTDITLSLQYGTDIDVWDINGTHLRDHKMIHNDDVHGVKATTYLYHDKVIVLESSPELSYDNQLIQEMTITLKQDQPYTIHKFMVVMSSNDSDTPLEDATSKIKEHTDYEMAKKEHVKQWDLLWQHFDIQIKHDLLSQIGYRFNTYHAIIATPVHKSLPIGARGLSCQAYQGSAFWDQEVFNLPMYLFTYPEIAKGILSYRYQTLDGARRKAKRHGYEGAFYAWISGKTGDELCPDFFFKDVLTDRKIRNHFNLWQIHISPDIAYTIRMYHQITKDDSFMIEEGLEMMLEISRFLASRVDYKPYRDRYEIIRVQGPDEYHENVDNNAFTNYQTHLALQWTLEYLKQYEDNVQEMISRIELTKEELLLWQDIVDKLYLPSPNDEGVLEQFDDYFSLESIVPATDVTKRLIDPEEYYGWPNGIAVFTQCNKQSDVVQLLHMQPHMFDRKTVAANYNYYEPRTLHFSSLSPSIHSIVACRINDLDRARHYFNKAISIDLMNTNEAVSGGTFIGGMHTAANAAVWQMMVYGFAGFSFEQGMMYLEPLLFPEWSSISFRLIIHRQELDITITQEDIIIKNKTNTESLALTIYNNQYTLEQTLEVPYNRN